MVAPGAASVIITVHNDRGGIAELMRGLSEQTQRPREIVIVDGGSSDGTLQELESWRLNGVPIRILKAPGANIATGRNIAVREAGCDWLVCTDAGCRPSPEWFATMCKARANADIVAGTFVVTARTKLDCAVACTHYPLLDELGTRSKLIRASHRLFGRDFRASLAGGRSMAFSRAAWEAVGGFPQDVYAGEDLAFTSKVIRAGFKAGLEPGAVVYWRPRASFRSTAAMFVIYARGDIRTPGWGRHVARFWTWTVGPSLFVRGGLYVRLLVWGGLLSYLWLPMQRAHRRGLPVRQWWRLPALLAAKDVSQIIGAMLGIVDALRGVPQPVPSRVDDLTDR